MTAMPNDNHPLTQRKKVKVNQDSSFVQSLTEPKSPMLHIKFQGHWSFGCREGDFNGSFPGMGMSAILVE